MATAPYGVRLLVGAATVAFEETMTLPRTILMYPMTLASQVAHLVMRFQQNLAELAIKGDSTLESLFPPKDEQPGWATFDEDLPNAIEVASAPFPDPEGLLGEVSGGMGALHGDRPAEGRFALYSISPTPGPGGDDSLTKPVPVEQTKKAAARATIPTPTVAAELDYQALTLAQLRARLHTLDINDLEALLAYEQTTTARAPFQTLLANRITRTSTK